MAQPRPYHALRHRDFRNLWLAQLVSGVGTQMQTAALHWHVYVLTRSPLALGFIGLTRVVPILALSLVGGVVADRRDRRRVMLAAQAAMTGISAILALATWRHRETLALLYALNGCIAAATAFDNPARQALVPRLVPDEDLPGALALNLAMFQATLIAGPGLAGVILAGSASLAPLHAAGARLGGTHGLAVVYGLNAVSFLGVLAILATMRTSGAITRVPDATEAHPLAAVREGLRFVWRTPILVWTTGIDFLATFFAGSMSLLPVFADQVLHVGPRGYGALVAAPALGALAMSVWLGVRPLPRRQGKVLLLAIAAYGVATVAYGLSSWFALTLLGLALTGMADLVSTVIRQTLRQLLTPDHLRGRMTSVNMIFFMGGPQLGELEAGLVASLFASAATGVRVSVVLGGVLTLALAVLAASRGPVRDYVALPPRT